MRDLMKRLCWRELRKPEDVYIQGYGCSLKEVLDLKRSTVLMATRLYQEDLSYVDLKNLDLSDIDFYGSNFVGTDFSHSLLCRSSMARANLDNAILDFCNLSEVSLAHASLVNTSFYVANLNQADLSDTDLSTAQNVPYIPYACPTSGSFIAWKKAFTVKMEPLLVKLEVPEDAKRLSATGSKCRCNKAKVLDITNLNGDKKYRTAISQYNPSFVYRVGTVVEVDDFDENRWNECSTGVHFFVDRYKAVTY